MLRRILLSAVFVLCAGAATSSAEPIRVGGSVLLSSSGRQMFFVLGAPGLPSIQGSVIDTTVILGRVEEARVTRPPIPRPLEAGQSYNLSSRVDFFGDAFPSSLGYYVSMEGFFEFAAGTATLAAVAPDLLLGRAPISRFAGQIRGFSTDTGELLFDYLVEHRRGEAFVRLSPGNPDAFEYSYGLNPVPEPATLTLVGCALVLLARRFRSRAT